MVKSRPGYYWRKGYTRSDGTRVKGSWVKLSSRKTSKSKGSKWIIRKGKLGGTGFLSKPIDTQHKLLTSCVNKYGYRSCLGSIMVLNRNRAIKAKHGAKITRLKNWLVKKYGKAKFGMCGARMQMDDDSSSVSDEENVTMGMRKCKHGRRKDGKCRKTPKRKSRANKTKKSKRKCKHGRRKDGKCRKTPKRTSRTKKGKKTKVKKVKKASKRKCKHGRRKDGKCRKTPKTPKRTSRTKKAKKTKVKKTHKNLPVQGCARQSTKKYVTRPGPAYPANQCCGMRKKGNDGRLYVSKRNVNGICQWKRV